MGVAGSARANQRGHSRSSQSPAPTPHHITPSHGNSGTSSSVMGLRVIQPSQFSAGAFICATNWPL